MVAVFLGKGVDFKFRQTVLRILKEKAEILEISDDKIEGRADEKSITIIFKNGPKTLNLSGGAVFLNQSENIEISNERYLICDSSNHSDLNLARKSDGEVITCGLSLRDSVTFSSLTEENCVISIQRSVTRFDGKKTEPCEIPCKISSTNDKYAVLCANLLLVLLGYI